MNNDKIDNSKVLRDLNDIIVMNYNASKGFQNAADNVNDSSLKRIFAESSTQRSRFLGELQEEVRILGGEPEKDSSALGDLHRSWMDIKSALASNKQHAILEACKTGEKAAVNTYDDLLEQSIPNNIRNIVQTQRTEVHSTLQQMSTLEKLESQ